jgi:hypothetical protein
MKTIQGSLQIQFHSLDLEWNEKGVLFAQSFLHQHIFLSDENNRKFDVMIPFSTILGLHKLGKL